VVKHLNILTKEDDTGWFSWARDTSSLLITVLAMFRDYDKVVDYFNENPKLVNEIYDNLDGHSEILGQPISNRILFASTLNVFTQKDKDAKTKITNVLTSRDGYFIESNILELNDILNTVKGIVSFDWDFDYKDAIFLQQKRAITTIIEQQETDEFGKGGTTTEETRTENEDIDPGYFYNPMSPVIYLGEEGEPKLVTALFIKAIADEKEWEQVMQNIRIGGDIFAIILGVITLGATSEFSALAIADLALASIDLALMNEDVQKWLSQYPEGKWFVENWDLIYALVGAGIMSVVMIEGILTHGPALLERVKNLKNIKENYLIFTKQLEKLIAELDIYKARTATSVIEEVVIMAKKNALLEKLLKPFLSSDANLEYIIEQLAKRKISVKKAGDNLYEIYYNGKLVTTTDANEAGVFLKDNFWKTERQLEEILVGAENKKLFSIWKINLKEGKYNCANCVIATDATLAGRPTSALPYTIQKRFRNGKWENYASFDEGTKPIVLETEFNAKFSDWTKDLNSLVKDLKPGKRGIVFGYKKGSDVGHVFNVSNENGTIKYLDGQTGKRAKLVYDQYKFLPTN
jgi:regulator of replication initiation timing